MTRRPNTGARLIAVALGAALLALPLGADADAGRGENLERRGKTHPRVGPTWST